MSWREEQRRVKLPDGRELIGASFRGVPFLVESHERAGGRRSSIHEFPKRDTPHNEDLGRRARAFPITGYLLGDDYQTQRDTLIAALEDYDTAGELVHPAYGSLRVRCSTYAARESTAELGIVRISIRFEEAPEFDIAPVAIADLAEQVAASAAAANTAADAELAARYDVAGQPNWSLESLATALSSVAELVGSALSGVAETTQELAELDAEILIITGTAATLVRDPADTMTALRDAIGAIADSALNAPRVVVRALLDAYTGYTEPTVPTGTATRTQEAENLSALSGALLQVLAIEAARLMPLTAYESIEDALTDRDELTEILDDLAATATDAAYPALVELKADLVAAIPGSDTTARRLTVNQVTAMPSLVLSYRLHGTTDAELKLVARNNPQHPGFMYGDLEVVLDE